MRHARPLARLAASIILSALPALRAGAQASVHAARCTDSIPAAELYRRVAYLEVSRPADISRGMASQIANFTQSIADHAQRLLGGDGSTIPPVEPTLTWTGVFGGIVVTAHKDGSYDAVPAPAGADDSGERFLVRAVDAMRAEGEPFLWPTGSDGDALSFMVSYRVSPVGTLGPLRLRAPLPAVPVFSVAVPDLASVEALGGSERHPQYPQAAQSVGAAGSVDLQFVVDASGRPVPGSITLLETPGERPGVFQHAFFEAARSAVIGSHYRPAHVGPCPVRQVVQQAFVFNINDQPIPRAR